MNLSIKNKSMEPLLTTKWVVMDLPDFLEFTGGDDDLKEPVEKCPIWTF